MPWRLGFTLLLSAVAGLALAGCGGGGGGGNTGASPRATGPASSSGAATVEVRDTALGKILVANGRTLYLFEKDEGSESTCYQACAQAWPPLMTSGSLKTASGAEASKLGTTMRTDGSTQVTYAGHPLYFFSGDSAPGETNGQGSEAFGAEWYVVSPAGTKIEGSEEGSGGGYG